MTAKMSGLSIGIAVLKQECRSHCIVFVVLYLHILNYKIRCIGDAFTFCIKTVKLEQ